MYIKGCTLELSVVSGKYPDMKIKKLKFVYVYLYVIVGMLIPLSASSNIALKASYTFKPAAQYDLTQDENDIIDLTDGVYVKGRIWLSKKTVGWRETGLIEIEVDLGSDYLISDICFNSARDEKVGISFPSRVEAFVSNDKASYIRVGDIYKGKKPDNGPYRVKKFCMNEMSNYGRYILLVVVPAGRFKFTFLDEIEVYGSRDNENKKITNSVRYRKHEIKEFIVSTNQKQNNKTVIRKKLKRLKVNASDEIKARIDTLITNIDSVINPDSEQIEKYQDNLLDITKEKNTKTIDKMLYIWRKPPWENFNPLLSPELTQGDITLSFELLDGISASDAIIITNYLDVAVTYEITMDWFGSELNTPDVEINNVVNVITSEYREVGDALVPYQGENITVKPGESKQIWLTVFNAEGGYGSYSGSLELKSSTGSEYNRRIPIEVKAFPAKTDQQEIYVNAWSYLHHPLITNQPAMVAQDLAEHHINVSVLHPAHIPWPVFSKDGSFIVSYTASDKSLSYQENVRKRLLFLNFKNEGFRSFNNQYAFMGEAWQKVFSKWVQNWVDHLKTQGLDYNDFAFYPVDEPKNDEEINILLRTAELIKEIDSRIEVYTTLGSMGSGDIIEARSLIDIYQVYIDDMSDLRVVTLQTLDKSMWIYSIPEGKSASPEYYRSQAWKAFQAGATGIGFWSYADIGWGGGSAWDDFDGKRPDYAVIYETNNYIVGSKRWEAWKAGVEDYKLLTMYKQVVPQEKITSLVDWVLDGSELENRYDIARAGMIKKLSLPWKLGNLKLEQN